MDSSRRSSNWLTLADISDLRAYERQRNSFRSEIIALKKLRRISVGPFVSLLFENRSTIRFQIQEMARVEKMSTDIQLLEELDAYNPLISGPGELVATMMIELTTEADLRIWLGKLVGIERKVQLVIGDAKSALSEKVIPGVPDESHDANLTRQDVTSSLHYLHFYLTDSDVESFSVSDVRLEISHSDYSYSAIISSETKQSLLDDLL